jgi:hypothetical protein
VDAEEVRVELREELDVGEFLDGPDDGVPGRVDNNVHRTRRGDRLGDGRVHLFGVGDVRDDTMECRGRRGEGLGLRQRAEHADDDVSGLQRLLGERVSNPARGTGDEARGRIRHAVLLATVSSWNCPNCILLDCPIR